MDSPYIIPSVPIVMPYYVQNKKNSTQLIYKYPSKPAKPMPIYKRKKQKKAIYELHLEGPLVSFQHRGPPTPRITFERPGHQHSSHAKRRADQTPAIPPQERLRPILHKVRSGRIHPTDGNKLRERRPEAADERLRLHHGGRLEDGPIGGRTPLPLVLRDSSVQRGGAGVGRLHEVGSVAEAGDQVHHGGVLSVVGGDDDGLGGARLHAQHVLVEIVGGPVAFGEDVLEDGDLVRVARVFLAEGEVGWPHAQVHGDCVRHDLG